MPENKKIIPVIIDTREQNPFLFRSYPCEVNINTLSTGDYSVSGSESECIIERKTVSDLAGCMTAGRDRFERELARMEQCESAAVIVEEPLSVITSGKYLSQLNPRSFEQSILSFSFRYRVPFLFGHNRIHAEWLAFCCLRHYWNKKNGGKIPFVDVPPMKKR